MFTRIIFGKRTTPTLAAAVPSTPPDLPQAGEVRATSPRRAAAPSAFSAPPTWRQQWHLITDARREAVVMMPIVPSDRSETPISFIGGAPYVSGQFMWPSGIPYRSSQPKPHYRPQPTLAPESRCFIGQIDCSEVPAVDGKRLLPQHGRLCFFFDRMIVENHAPYEHPHADAVVWDNGDGPLREAELPRDLPPSQYSEWIPKSEPDQYLRSFDKWALEFRTIQTYPDETYLDPSGGSQPVYRAIVNRLMREQFRRILPDPPREPPIVFRPGLPRPSATFPECWIHVYITVGLFAASLERAASHAPPILRDEYIATSGELEREAILAGTKPPFETLSSDERQEFYAWYESLIAPKRDGISDVRTSMYLGGHIRSAYHLAADMLASRGGELAELLDADGINTARLNRSPYCIRRDGHSDIRRWHQMFGHGGNVQAAAQQFRSSHVLLAQFSSDRNGPFMWGDAGMLQYWIDADDLAARDFSRVYVTVESH